MVGSAVDVERFVVGLTVTVVYRSGEVKRDIEEVDYFLVCFCGDF